MCTGPTPTRPSSDARQEVVVRCLACHAPLNHRKSPKRKRNGIEYEVGAHFAHHSGTGCSSSGSPQSTEHLAVKQIVLRHCADIVFVYHCTRCDQAIPITIPGTSVAEKGFGPYHLDVAFRDAEGNTTGCLEGAAHPPNGGGQGALSHGEEPRVGRGDHHQSVGRG